MMYLSEKAKMLAYLYHNTDDKELDSEKMAAHDLCLRYNRLRPSDIEGRARLLAELLPHAHPSTRIEPPFQCELGYNTYIGEDFRADEGLMILDNGRVTFGDGVRVGARCVFSSPVHPLTPQKRNTWHIFMLPITVGSCVCFGPNVRVLAGVTIGDNAVIDAGSVVTKDIPANCVAGGDPALVIRRLRKDELE